MFISLKDFWVSLKCYMMSLTCPSFSDQTLKSPCWEMWRILLHNQPYCQHLETLEMKTNICQYWPFTTRFILTPHSQTCFWRFWCPKLHTSEVWVVTRSINNMYHADFISIRKLLVKSACYISFTLPHRKKESRCFCELLGTSNRVFRVRKVRKRLCTEMFLMKLIFGSWITFFVKMSC